MLTVSLLCQCKLSLLCRLKLVPKSLRPSSAPRAAWLLAPITTLQTQVFQFRILFDSVFDTFFDQKACLGISLEKAFARSETRIDLKKRSPRCMGAIFPPKTSSRNNILTWNPYKIKAFWGPNAPFSGNSCFRSKIALKNDQKTIPTEHGNDISRKILEREQHFNIETLQRTAFWRPKCAVLGNGAFRTQNRTEVATFFYRSGASPVEVPELDRDHNNPDPTRLENYVNRFQYD